MKNKKLLNAILIVIAVIFVSLAFLFLIKANKGKVSEAPQPKPASDPGLHLDEPEQPDPGPSYEVDPNAERFYKISVVQMYPAKGEGMIYPFVPYALPEIFGLKKVKASGYEDMIPGVPEVFFDKSRTHDFDNQSGTYYLVLRKDNAKNLEYKLYQNTDFLITVVPLADRKVIPYLEDVRYCEADSDCSISNYFCSSGSYNKYRKMAVYGCESGDGSISENDKALCDLATTHPVIKYGNPTCVNHSCTTDSRTISCETGAYSEGP